MVIYLHEEKIHHVKKENSYFVINYKYIINIITKITLGEKRL
jgi:hypothetical protein